MRRLSSSPALCSMTLMLVGWTLIPSSAHSQQRISLEGHSGVAVPVGSFSSLAGPGANVGMQIAYAARERVAVSVDGDVDLLRGVNLSSGKAPNLRLWRYGAGVEASVLQPRASRWSLVAGVGLGATTFETDDFTLPGTTDSQSLTKTYFTSSSALRLQYAVGSRVSAHLGGGARWMSANREDMQVLQSLDPTRVKEISSAWSVPVTVGMKIRTGRSPTATLAAAPAARPATTPASSAPQPRATEDARAAAIAILQERVHFDFDRTDIKPEYARVLERKAEVLRQYPDIRIRIEGHCDEWGSAEYNVALGHRRAIVVKDFLKSLGVAEAQMETTSFGKERPLTMESNERAWGQNRRAEFVVEAAR